ncbi:MAG: lipase maturation factor family protein, partial [Actinomycetota bacterium]|nr:lipase maturation factor family protein [Actinomycetota bacterium]
MQWLEAPTYWLSRFLLERSIAAVYLIAFVVALNQFPALLGERGLLPVPRFLRAVPWQRAPSIFYMHYSDRFLRAVACTGAVVAAALVAGIPQSGPAWVTLLGWGVLWCLYLSIVNVGQTFYGFGWESLLLEAGALAIFLGPSRLAPPAVILWLFRWLLFRLEFGAGLIKLRGDRCWRDLTCLYYHHETQPMPNPMSWYFHRLPKAAHRIEVLGNHVAQLLIPVLLFCPQPLAGGAAIAVIVHQSWLVVSGNFSWLNALTIALAFSALDDRQLRVLLPFHHGAIAPAPPWFTVLPLLFAACVVLLSYRPARNLVSRRQLMNASFDPLHLVNTYGAFGSITKERYEIIIEGANGGDPADASGWREYEFKGKPGDPRRRPRQVAPYHLRLDWLMWFAAMSSPLSHRWLIALVEKLLAGDEQTLKLLRRNP